MADALPQKRAADGPPDEGAAAAAEPAEPAGNTPVEYLTLSANAEPLRLDSLCTNCMRNVRRGRCCAVLRPLRTG